MIYKNLNSLKKEIERLKSQGKIIVWTNGCFDIIHPGHMETFKESKKLGDILILGLNGDKSPYWKEKPGRPINNEDFGLIVKSVWLRGVKFSHKGEKELV